MMATLSQFRPPQFSEDAAWLPVWLQQCNAEQLDVEGVDNDHPTFEQRIEEWHPFHHSISNGESLREDGRCNVGQLFLSGTDSSPFSFAQSAGNVVHFHLCLSSDGNSEDTTLTDAQPAAAASPLATQTVENPVSLGLKDVNLSLCHNANEVIMSPTVELERPVDKNELLKHDGNEKLSEAAADAVELCIEASEALVINEVIESDSFAKHSSVSAILEASLQLKQARLEVWRTTISNLTEKIHEIDKLSDLDDVTMENAYEDVGVHFNELSAYEQSVSQVKDTLDSECHEYSKSEKVSAFATACGKSYNKNSTYRPEGDTDFDRELEKDFVAERVDGDMKTDSPAFGLCTEVVCYNDYLSPVEAQSECGLLVSEKNANAPVAEKVSESTNVSYSPLMSCQDPDKDDSVSNIIQDRFQSRWFGGWTGNNEVKHFTSVRSIPEPFACETSFFSESADVAPDENSFVHNHDKEAVVASQLSIPSNFGNRANGVIKFSQDVRSSSASLMDTLCSVVPCSISDNICSSPAVQPDNDVLPTTEHTKDNVVGSFTSKNELAQGERIDMPISIIMEPRNEVCRRFVLLSNYSKLLSNTANPFEKENCHQKKSFLIDDPELTLQEKLCSNYKDSVKDGAEIPVLHKKSSPSLIEIRGTQHCFQASNCSMINLAQENPRRTVLPESSLKCLPNENLQWSLSKGKNKNAQKSAPKRVHFSEKEAEIAENNKLQKVESTSKSGCSTRAPKRSTRSTKYLESRGQKQKIIVKSPLDKKKRLIFQDMEFLLTGFSHEKEKEIEGLIQKYGGVVLSQIPSTNLKGKRSSRVNPPVLPVVLCLKKIQSFKFLYGCALNAFVLKAVWLVDSVAAGFALPAEKYMILPRNTGRRHHIVYTAIKYDKHSLVFNNLGIMLYGKSKFLTNIETIIKHGGGQVFRTLQRLVQSFEAGKILTGVVVADDESCASRHLKHCALEKSIPMTSVSWIIKSLYAGRLIPLEEKMKFRCLPALKLQRVQDSMELSQEI